MQLHALNINDIKYCPAVPTIKDFVRMNIGYFVA